MFFVLFLCTVAFCQKSERQIIQFSGIVTSKATANNVPGVHIYVPKRGSGTTSDQFGFFTMPLLVGDSVVISAVGFERKSMTIPAPKDDNLNVIIELEEDTTYLREIEVFPFPTEEMFKEAVLTLNLPNADDYNAMQQNLNNIQSNSWYMGEMDPSMNYRYYMNQKFMYINDGFGPRYNPFLNPFNWASFIKSLKKDD